MNVNALNQAVSLLKAGRLVAFPTETVYGLGADARNEAAVRNIFKAKQRPFHHPLIVHLHEFDQINEWVKEIPPAALRLAEQFWPGPLTLILPKRADVLGIVTGEQQSIGIRIPSHPIAQALLKAFGGGVAAPSANLFTHVSPTTAAAVQEELGSAVDLILDGGECEVGLESTIIDFSQDQPRLLRPGMLTKEALEEALQCPILLPGGESTRAPGMHPVHYAPQTQARLITSDELAQLQDLSQIAIISTTLSAIPEKNALKWVQLGANPARYAHDLYRTLRELDHLAPRLILIEAVPNLPAWQAIADRLTKACAR